MFLKKWKNPDFVFLKIKFRFGTHIEFKSSKG
jgi:hypothetical protein